MNSDILAVNEIYGPVFQGEGRNLGMPCMFLRLAGCNLACVWCDTKYAWDWKHYDSREELHPMTIEQVLEKLQDAPVRALVVTGGEPMLQQANLLRLIHALNGIGWVVEIETAGTIAPSEFHHWTTQFTVSPKLSNSGNALKKMYKPDALARFVQSGAAIFKFVACNMDDLYEVDWLVSSNKIPPGSVYIMPEGTDAETIQTGLLTLAPEVIKRGYRLTTRLHVLMYGKQRRV